MSTENIAYEKRYWDWRAQYDTMFAPENRFPLQDEQFPLVDGYSVRSKAYFYNGDLHLNGSESGKHYLIFRTELYGYSVLEVESGQELHYVPACVYPEAGRKAEEVFIWTSADYDLGSDLLAVTGCIWACPCSTIVLDFSSPLQPHPRRVGWMCGASLTRTIPGSKADGHDTLRTAAGQSREHQG